MPIMFRQVFSLPSIEDCKSNRRPVVATRCKDVRGSSTAAEGFIANQRHDERLYRKYKDYYGYVFYIRRKG